MSGAAARHDDLKVHLLVLGEEHEIEARARVGRTKLMEVLPLARELSEKVTGIALEHARSEGKEISCRAGCGACCRQIVPVSPLEAVRLAQVVERMPKARRKEIERRFAAAVKALEDAKLIDGGAKRGRAALLSTETSEKARWEDVSHRYFALGIPCPFLENESCGIYAERPAVCREFHVTTPAELCATLDPRLEATPRPVRMSEVLTDLSNEVLGRDDRGIPLTLALAWANVHRATLEAHEGVGEALALALCDCIQAADSE